MKSKIDYAEKVTEAKSMDDIYEKYGLNHEQAMDIFKSMTDEQQRAVRVLCTWECNKVMESFNDILKELRKGTVLDPKRKAIEAAKQSKGEQIKNKD